MEVNTEEMGIAYNLNKRISLQNITDMATMEGNKTNTLETNENLDKRYDTACEILNEELKDNGFLYMDDQKITQLLDIIERYATERSDISFILGMKCLTRINLLLNL